MKIVENKILNIVFQLAIAVGIAGLVMFLIQEIVIIWSIGTAYTVILVIADFVGIVALVTFIVWMFLQSKRDIALNIAFIGGAIFVFLYSFAHFFVVAHRTNTGSAPNTGSLLGDFISSGVSLIGLTFLTLFSGFMIVVFALRFVKQREMPVYEKFSVIIWLLVLALYDFSGFYYVKQSLTYGTSLTTLLGITFLPNTLELIFLLFAATLVIFKLFGKMDTKVEKIMILTLVNALFIALAITTVNSIGFVFSAPTVYIPSVIGNHFIMGSTIAVMIVTFITLIREYPVRAR